MGAAVTIGVYLEVEVDPMTCLSKGAGQRDVPKIINIPVAVLVMRFPPGHLFHLIKAHLTRTLYPAG
jgi:hypothetical protein